jgi:hypothetical protein
MTLVWYIKECVRSGHPTNHALADRGSKITQFLQETKVQERFQNRSVWKVEFFTKLNEIVCHLAHSEKYNE